ncbi:MAG: hypothetical protein A2015_04240 [Spirochaetes bacterium GWF1_31_7]|nr:MAG: hypothetical protein A2Y30_17030 [Spirochaetes bacterium GWE1_32_154]OHD47403.1 MAG: hypothetical protein A2Y29_10040 [Spirochaetes bacterium GWE2_31_10]OHD52930.1 MAG: hypothetical protein A2015_04240 [Spirochaetes bacterium GWF1_31_7]OHD77750.1 MAG: hypothetical protein A2355_06880 [Spirochaetes bacterium RIFOXYB1_FULL_32_8]HBD93673.1 hypothetical protein [Spirochaetia bacterium]
MNPDVIPAYIVTTSKSRLYHSDAVKESVESGVIKRMKTIYPSYSPKDGSIKIFVRVADDRVTISLDSSGDPLYCRGYKTMISDAPLRENIASAILLHYNLNDFDEIIDPMCGTGTFLLESLIQLQVKNHCGLRSFSFENWPVFSEATFNYIQKKHLAESQKTTVKITGSDISAKNIDCCKKNLENLHGEHTTDSVTFYQADFFNLRKMSEKLLVVINPPYGKRIETDSSLNDFYIKIGNKLKKDFKGAECAIIVPGIEAEKALGLRYTSKIPFMNGGLPVAVLYLTV